MNKSKEQLKLQILIEIGLFLALAIICAMVILKDYSERPGIIKAGDFSAIKRTDSSITLEWDENRNTDSYAIFYKKKGKDIKEWNRISLKNSNRKPVTKVTVDGLEAGTDYCWIMRPDNEDRKGFSSDAVVIPTKSQQKIKVKTNRVALKATKHIHLNAKAASPLSYESSNKKVATVDRHGKVKLKGGGTATITITALESKDYLKATKTVEVNVLDAKPVKSSKAKANVIFKLTSKNCEKLINVTRGGTPQSLAYTGDKYIVAYNSGNSGLAIYSKNGKLLKTERTSILGHANGLTYCDSANCCYGVRGSSARVDIYDMKTGKFSKTSSKYSGSGIAYDRVKDVIYLSSRTGIRVYTADGKFTHKKLMANCLHSGHVYTQDCCGYDGIVIRCCSGHNKHSVNYLDIYNVKNEEYIGSLFCDIGEVESAIVDKDGYLELLINSRRDYVWKTPINMADIAR